MDGAYNAVDWNLLVTQVKRGEVDATEQLRKLFSRGVRFYLCRQLGTEDVDDRVRETFLMVEQAIQHGEIREPERLTGFVRTVLTHQVISCVDQMRRSPHPQAVAATKKTSEQEAMILQVSELMKNAMNKLPARDREILLRFYVREQSWERICQEMKITENQFRLTISHAKARFGNMVKVVNSK